MTLSTRATIHVPSPETSMSLGRAWSGTDWNADGFSAVAGDVLPAAEALGASTGLSIRSGVSVADKSSPSSFISKLAGQRISVPNRR